MAKISFVYPIEEIVGKLKGKFGAGRHKAANAKGLRNQWTIHYGTRTTPKTTTETAHQTWFGTVAAATTARLKNPQKQAADRTAFAAQSQYKTLRQYVWAQCAAELED